MLFSTTSCSRGECQCAGHLSLDHSPPVPVFAPPLPPCRQTTGPVLVTPLWHRGLHNEGKKKLGVSNTPYDGGRWVTDGGWWVTDGGWWVTDGGWWVTDGGWWVTDGGWWVTDGGWSVATKHQRVDATVKKKGGERPYGTPCCGSLVVYRGGGVDNFDNPPCPGVEGVTRVLFCLV